MRSCCSTSILALCGAAAAAVSCIGVTALIPAVGYHPLMSIRWRGTTKRKTAIIPLPVRTRPSTAHKSSLPDEPMEDRFDRWRLLQNILDLHIEEAQVEALVETVVAGSAAIPPGGGGGVPAEAAAAAAPINNGGGWSQYRNNVLALERRYLPDPDDEKDAFDSLWDTVSEIHGRDAVKIDLRVEPRWPYVCCLARILLQYDFLSRGIVAEEVDKEERKDQEMTMNGSGKETVLQMEDENHVS